MWCDFAGSTRRRPCALVLPPCALVAKQNYLSVQSKVVVECMCVECIRVRASLASYPLPRHAGLHVSNVTPRASHVVTKSPTYRVNSAHQTWQIETAAWISPVPFTMCFRRHRAVRFRTMCSNIETTAGWLGCRLVYVCLETRWLGQKSGSCLAVCRDATVPVSTLMWRWPLSGRVYASPCAMYVSMCPGARVRLCSVLS